MDALRCWRNIAWKLSAVRFWKILVKFWVSGPFFFADTWLKWYHCAMAKLESDPLVKKHEKGSLSHWKWVENGLLNIPLTTVFHPQGEGPTGPVSQQLLFWCEIISPIVSNVSLLEMQHPRFGFVNVLHSPLAISDVFCVVKNHLVIIIGFWFPNPERYKMLEITQTHFGKRSIPKTDLSYQSIFWSHRAWFTWARCKCSGKNPGHEKIHRFLGRPTKRSASPNEPMKYEVDVRS